MVAQGRHIAPAMETEHQTAKIIIDHHWLPVISPLKWPLRDPETRHAFILSQDGGQEGDG